MATRTSLLAGILLAASALAAHAQTPLKRDPVNGNDLNNGSTVRQLIGALERTAERHPTYRDQLGRLRKGVGLVFVPGILGSTLESPSAGKIWGFGMPNPDTLALPRELIDPAAASDVQARLADSMFGMPLYGDAMRMIRESAAKAGIAPERIVACGYDWRRDIRAGAADLQNCIANAPELADVDAIVVVAHSMGGVVTWVWHQQQAPRGELPNGVRVLAVAVLGSPLAGSCEIVRMINSGYVQPAADEQYVRGTWLSRWWNEIKGMKDRLVNAVSGVISNPIRPLVLTWPGAIDLGPPPAASRYQNNCALVPFNPDDLGDSRILTHYQPDFWTKPIGVDLLNGAQLPATYSDVLAQAERFRREFELKTLESPTYLYASQAWVTPAQAPVDATDNYRLAKTDWLPMQGDGRVPFLAAVPEGVAAAEVRPLYSVHGNLPEDQLFHAAFFGDRLPRVMNGWIAAQVLARAADDPAFLKDYLADKGPFANPSDFYTIYEPDRGAPARYRISNESRETARTFNDALCQAGAPCPGYTQAKTLASAKATNAGRAAVFSASLRSGALSDDDRVFVIAQRGLAMALERNWTAAITDLREAVDGLDKRRQLKGGRESDREKQLRVAVNANLGRALAIRGFCTDAVKPLQIGAAGGNEQAARTLRAPCYDRESGKVVAFGR